MIPSAETLRRAGEILSEIEKLQAEMAQLFGGTVAVGAPPARRRGRPPGSGMGKRRRMSPEARARIAAAAKARWAKYRADKKSGK